MPFLILSLASVALSLSIRFKALLYESDLQLTGLYGQIHEAGECKTVCVWEGGVSCLVCLDSNVLFLILPLASAVVKIMRQVIF